MPANKINVSAHCANNTAHAKAEQNRCSSSRPCHNFHNSARFAWKEMSLKLGNNSTHKV